MQSKTFIYLLAAGIALLPACGTAAEKKDIHHVMAAEEHHADAAAQGPAPAPDAEMPPAKEDAVDASLAEEMDEISDAPEDGAARDAEPERADDDAHRAASAADADTPADTDADAAPPPQPRGGTGAAVSGAETAADAAGRAHAQRSAAGSGHDAAHGTAAADAPDAAAYEAATAIERVTLADGDWVFIEGDLRRGWFFDRSRMARNADGTISYWQLILYNELGSAQFAEAMRDTSYETLRYTLQRRVLDPKANTVRTYEIIAYDADGAVLAESARSGAPAEIRKDTMAAQERDAVKKVARGLKPKQ